MSKFQERIPLICWVVIILLVSEIQASPGLARSSVVERTTEYRNPVTGAIVLQRQLVMEEDRLSGLGARRSGPERLRGDDLEDMNVAGPSVRLDHAGPIEFAFRPSLRRGSSGELGAVWMEGPQGYQKVWFGYSLDGGLSWSPPERVDHVGGDGIRALNPVVEFDASGNVLVVWDYVDFQNGPFRTYFRKRSPVWGPAEWGPAKRLQEVNGNTQQYPSIVAVDEARYFVVWGYEPAGAPPQVFLRRTNDGGETWSEDFQVSHNPPGSFFIARDPALAVDVEKRSPGQETVYVATTEWRNNSFPDVYAYRSTDGGVTWNEGIRVSDIGTGFQSMYREGLTQTSDGTLTALWDNDGGGYVDVRLRQSTDGGESWGPVAIVDPPGIGVSIYPSLRSLENRLAVAWTGHLLGSAEDHIFARFSSTSSASSFGPAIRMSDTEGLASPRSPSCLLDDTGLVCGWDDYRDPYQTQVYAARADLLDASSVSGSAVREGGLQLVCQPNPASGWAGTRVSWGAPEGSPRVEWASHELRPGTILLHDVSGRLVRRVEVSDVASRSLLLTPTFAGPGPVAAGVYLVTLVAPGFPASTARLCVVR